MNTIQNLTEQCIKCKNPGLEIQSQAIKAIINSGYGVFGHSSFKYYDIELMTAFSRDTLTKMQGVNKKLGFVVLYDDTNSLFVSNVKNTEDANSFISEYKSKLGVDVGHEKTFSN